MEPGRKGPAAWAALTVAGVLLAFAPAVVGLRTLAQRDTDRLFAPVRTLVVEALREGRLPLWNPYESMGKPLFAEGFHSVLHPVSLGAAALAPSSIDFLLLAYLGAAALGAFLLARTLGGSPPASAAAGLAFALSGFSVSMTGNVVFLAGLSTLPWLLAAARAAGAGSPWGAVAVALATASAFFSGDAQTAFVGLALGTLLAADAGGLRGTLRALAGMAVGLLLAGVQIYPTRELLPLTTRGGPLADWEKVQWALSPGRMLEWVLPGLFRGPPGVVAATASGARLDPLFAESLYLGAPLLVAAVIGARVRPLAGRRRAALLLAGAAIVLLWLALGHHLGARRVLDWVPVWNRFRFSEKLMAPLTLCLCALGALGVDAFGAGRIAKGWRRALGAATLAAGALLLALLLAPDATGAGATRLLGDAGPFYRSTLAAGLPHLVAGLGALLAVDRLRSERARSSALALLLALSPAAAVYFGAHLGSPAAHRLSSPLRLVADSPSPRIAQPAEGIFYPAERQNQVDVTALHRARLLYPATNVAHRVDTIDHYGSFPSLRIERLVASFGDAWVRSARRFALTHVAVPFPYGLVFREPVALAVEGGRLVRRDEPLRFELWEVPHRPWAFFARRTVAAEGAEEARGLLLELLAAGDDGTVVVEAPVAPLVAPGRVLQVERGTGTIRVEAESLGPALLVLQDAWWPGWRAAIDGEPVEILAADSLVRAVRWPAGRHRLELLYDPPELRVGLALSGAGAGLLLLLAALATVLTRGHRG